MKIGYNTFAAQAASVIKENRLPSRTHPPVVVLVRPQLSENIGAAARAMANFGARDLRLVAPKPFDPDLARRMACAGAPLLAAAKIFPDLASAVADCALTIATTRRHRRVKLPAPPPKDAVRRLADLPAGAQGALVFGAEQAGLSNEDVYACDFTSTIPTTREGSLNLGQAVLLYLYEWHLTAEKEPPPAWISPPATHAEKQRVYALMEKLLVRADYQPRQKAPEFIRRVKLVAETRLPTHREQRIVLKLLRHLEKLVDALPRRRP